MVSTAVNFDLNNGVLAEKIIMVQGASKQRRLQESSFYYI
jgi:hypothetical protein